jgi:hypothetical protein
MFVGVGADVTDAAAMMNREEPLRLWEQTNWEELLRLCQRRRDATKEWSARK